VLLIRPTWHNPRAFACTSPESPDLPPPSISRTSSESSLIDNEASFAPLSPQTSKLFFCTLVVLVVLAVRRRPQKKTHLHGRRRVA
jgi:hypothetical protein